LRPELKEGMAQHGWVVGRSCLSPREWSKKGKRSRVMTACRKGSILSHFPKEERKPGDGARAPLLPEEGGKKKEGPAGIIPVQTGVHGFSKRATARPST